MLPLEYQLCFLPMGNPKPTFVNKKQITIIIIVATVYGKATSSQALCYWFYIKYSYTCILPVSHRPPIHICYLHTHIPRIHIYHPQTYTTCVTYTTYTHIPGTDIYYITACKYHGTILQMSTSETQKS